jgi:hypothetical protein
MNGVVELGYSRFLALNPKYTKKRWQEEFPVAGINAVGQEN